VKFAILKKNLLGRQEYTVNCKAVDNKNLFRELGVPGAAAAIVPATNTATWI
jgi:hypothetical protein